MRKGLLKKLKKAVIKIGTSVIAAPDNNLDKKRLQDIVFQVCLLEQYDISAILVTSGAIGTGMGILGLTERPQDLPMLQACAAIGQGELMHYYSQYFRAKGRICAQILLTKEDLKEGSPRFRNATSTVSKLLESKVIPIINENDTVAVDEIKFGDNDELSSLVAKLLHADILIILSDVDGLHDGDCRLKENLIHIVEEITPEIEKMAKGTSKAACSGGMLTKIKAANVTTSSGIPLVIANGREPQVLSRIIAGEEIGTIFTAKT